MTPPGRPPDAAIPKVAPRLLKLDAGTSLWRVHSTRRSATDFKDKPTDAVFGGGRFDSTHTDPYPFLYAAPEPETAIMETLTRSLPFHFKRFRTIRRVTVANMTLSCVLVTEPLTMISLMSGIDLASALQDEWLIQCGSGDYPQTRRWAAWLRQQVPAAQGIAWMSRRNVGAQSVILFGDRCDDALALTSVPATDLESAAGADWLNARLEPYRTRIIRPAARRIVPPPPASVSRA